MLRLAKKGKYRAGANHPRWKGGRCARNGYVEVLLQADDPFFPMAVANHYVREHRLVMARYLGRNLLPKELVHHLNGIRNDNRLENLELVSLPNHSRSHYELLKEVRLLRQQVRELTMAFQFIERGITKQVGITVTKKTNGQP